VKLLSIALLPLQRSYYWDLVVLSLPKKKILTQPEIRKLSKVLQDLFIPALIFSNFIGVKFHQIISYFPVVIMTIVIIVIGIYMGKLASKFCGNGKEFAVMFPVVCGFAHTINIHLSMVETLGEMLDKSDAFSNKEYELSATSRGIVFTMINSVVNTIVRWSLMTKMIKEGEIDDKSEQENALEMKLLANPTNNDQVQTQPVQEKKESFWKKIDSMLNGPLITAFVSLALIMIPPLQDIFIEEESFIYQTITKTAKLIGKTSSSLLLLSLGGNLAGPRTEERSTSYKAIASISVAKLVVMPIIGFVIIFLLKYLSLLNDSVMAFVLFISFAVPTANNILIQYATLGKDTTQLSKVVLASYAFAVISLPFFLVLFLSFYL